MCTDICPRRARPPRDTAVHGLRAGGRVPHMGSGPLSTLRHWGLLGGSVHAGPGVCQEAPQQGVRL